MAATEMHAGVRGDFSRAREQGTKMRGEICLFRGKIRAGSRKIVEISAALSSAGDSLRHVVGCCRRSSVIIET